MGDSGHRSSVQKDYFCAARIAREVVLTPRYLFAFAPISGKAKRHSFRPTGNKTADHNGQPHEMPAQCIIASPYMKAVGSWSRYCLTPRWV
jgi:hypothetical protein